jgi:stage V sporulation protein B
MSDIVQGTLILFSAGLFNRILGFAYRIALARALGAEGMGLLAMVQPVIFFAVTLCTAGLPVAVSKIVAERAAVAPQRVGQVLQVGLRIVAVLSAAATLLLLLLARFVSTHLLTDPRSFYPLLALTPLLGIVSVSVVYRGYFQGLQRMAPTAVAQVIEQVVRIGFVFFLLHAFVRYGTAVATASAAAGVVMGEFAGLLTLLVAFRLGRVAPAGPPARPEEVRATLVEVSRIALPVTFTRIVASVTEVLDAAVIPRRLEASGYTRAMATAFFGNLYGMAMPLLFFPTVFTFALAQNLVPAVSSAEARRDFPLVRRRSDQAIRLAAYVSFPTSVVFLALGHRLGLLFYGERAVGDLIVPLALAAPFLYLEVTVSAILRGLGLAATATLNGLAGSALRLALVFALTTRPGFGARAVLVAISCDLALSFVLNLRSLMRVTGLTADLGHWLLRPLLASAAMYLALNPARLALEAAGLGAWPGTLAALAAAALVYLAGLWALGARLRWAP